MLDEPTNGLDPQGIREIRDCCCSCTRAGTTVFLSSHLLAEVEQLCTRVGVLDRGRLVVQAELAELQAPTGAPSSARPERRRRGRCWTAGSRTGRRAAAWCGARTRPELNALLVGAGVRVTELGRSAGPWSRSVLRADRRRAATGWTGRPMIGVELLQAVPPARAPG